MLLRISSFISHVCSLLQADPACSDILVDTPGHVFFGHNEDGDKAVASGAFIHHAAPTGLTTTSDA